LLPSSSDEADTMDSSANNSLSTTEDHTQSTLKIRLARCQYIPAFLDNTAS